MTPSPTRALEPSLTLAPSATPVPSPSPTLVLPTATPSQEPTPSPEPSLTPTPEPSPSPVPSPSPSPLPPPDRFPESSLRFEARGHHYSLALNGQHMLDVDDARYDDGEGIGVWSDRAPVAVTDFRLYAP